MSKKLEDCEKEELLEIIKQLKSRKKFGLVWEEKPEHVVEQCKKELPVLMEVPERAITKLDDAPTNLVIEGDNYHALSVLNYTHAGKMDVIYIDPPYNTGAKNWKYNNNYVDKDDEYRHSRWLSFMHHRLDLAKNLLKNDGVLICAIDENEQAHLGVLIEQLFPAHEQHVVTIVHNPKGVQGTNFSYTHEYALFLVPKNKKTIGDRSLTEDEIYVSNLRNWGNESERTDAKNCFYPIIVSAGKIVGFGEVMSSDVHPKSANEKREDGSTYVWPIDEKNIERKWRYARQSVEAIKDILQIKESRSGVIQIMIAKDYGTYKTVWTDKKYDASEYGTKLLRKILPNCDFDFPKSLYTVYDCLFSVVGQRPHANILDFFAGSGTTGHAVLQLNKEDGGSRQFILCTNNENGIAEQVTYPRIQNVIEGYDDTEGIPANVRYYKTAFVTKNSATDDTRYELVQRAADMICVREGTFKQVINTETIKLYSGANHHTAILYDFNQIDKIKEEIEKLDDKPVHIYVFSLTNDSYESDFADLRQNHELCPIPESILEVYRRIFGGN